MCKRFLPLLFVLLFLVFFILAPLLILIEQPRMLRFIFLVDLVFLSLFWLIYQRNRNALDHLRLKEEELQETTNLAEKEVIGSRELESALAQKIRNYERLKEFTGQLNQQTTLEDVCGIVVKEAFELFGMRGNVLLYLIGEKNRSLELSTVRTAENEKIREKRGDLFDHWVLRHSQPLLVEDASSDFRFNPEKIKEATSRPIGSVIGVPLVTESRCLGILRIDTPSSGQLDSEDLRFLAVVADIAKLALENAISLSHMQELSIVDGVTGAFLRRFGMERLKEELTRALREGSPLSFLMLDIDHFKSFNDRYGHMGGDVVLKRLAKWLKDFFCMPGKAVVRYGGEEFCVILPHVRKKEAVKLAEAFRKFAKEKNVSIRRQKVHITVSIGVSNFPEDVRLGEDLIHHADQALLKAKRSGRDKVCHS